MTVRQDDEILLTGTASSPHGLRLDRAPCVVATVSDDALKVWPLGEMGESHPKVWMPASAVEAVEIVSRGE